MNYGLSPIYGLVVDSKRETNRQQCFRSVAGVTDRPCFYTEPFKPEKNEINGWSKGGRTPARAEGRRVLVSLQCRLARLTFSHFPIFWQQGSWLPARREAMKQSSRSLHGREPSAQRSGSLTRPTALPVRTLNYEIEGLSLTLLRTIIALRG